ncbi:hypothetical protein BK004_00130 [bacterium CG10_46_32]|nr:MAG: hypothetical protein BK004_00130 [bacterium CG10_46_32]PIR56531.1 MAG: hypothetical protein COU73_00130 [Parcubacteria group bacterium CG10_big_fil_rev_8_21_14_0_10_46_32]
MRNQQGQGLLETIVALGIIVSGVVGMLNLTVSNQTSTEDSSERLIATNLGREGVEIVRNIRDTNWLSCEIIGGVLSCNTWDQGLVSGVDTTAVPLFNAVTNAWIIDFTPDDLTHTYTRVWRYSSGVAENIGTQFQTTELTPANADVTSYRRLLDISSICEDKTIATSCSAGNPKIGIRVQSIVEWTARGKQNSLTSEERLFNWR